MCWPKRPNRNLSPTWHRNVGTIFLAYLFSVGAKVLQERSSSRSYRKWCHHLDRSLCFEAVPLYHKIRTKFGSWQVTTLSRLQWIPKKMFLLPSRKKKQLFLGQAFWHTVSDSSPRGTPLKICNLFKSILWK